MSYIRENQAKLERLLADLVAFQTESPPARNAAGAQAFVAQYLSDLGFSIDQWEVFPGDPNVVGIRKGSPEHRSLIINTHVDVAHVGEPSDWTVEPFALTRKGCRVYGRGVADMKGGTAAALFALKALKATGELPQGEIIFESVIGEEMGDAAIPAAICGPGELKEAHGVDESVDWEQLLQAAELYFDFIKGWCDGRR